LIRLLIASDAWHPQINGVVRSLEQMVAHAPAFDAEISLLTPLEFPTLPMPSYPEIRLALASRRAVAKRFKSFAPTHVHIATEGPIGFTTRRICLAHGFPYTTSYHTRFPEYIAARVPIPERWTYRLIRRFHNAGRGIMVATSALESELQQRGFNHLMLWGRGVDTTLFHPERARNIDLGCTRPVFLYVGRVAVEKNVEKFLSLDLPGSKVVVGDGPAREELSQRYPDTRFLGPLTGEALANVYAAADVFVFPSLTDTFGMVLLEAIASGVPIAAFPTSGPMEIVADSGCGVLDQDLHEAALAALGVSREACRARAEEFSWHESARQFYENVRRGNEGVEPIDIRRID
jgi:glycosyltransferase involved in cell wall biosynthesis